MSIVGKEFQKKIGNEMEFALVNELIRGYVIRESDKYINQSIKSKLERIENS